MKILVTSNDIIYYILDVELYMTFEKWSELQMKKNKKILILSGIVIVVVLAVVLVVAMSNRGHRLIKVESVEGEVELERESKEKDVFEGMNLRSEDMVTTGDDGLLGVVADEDKYITAIENTCFEIISKGSKKEGRLKIKLKYGTTLIEIENKLPEGASFEVETPNAALSVRGTTFEVTYIPESNTTILAVTEGKVEVETNTETQMVPAGGTAIITDEHITYATVDSMAGAITPVIPEDGVGNELTGVIVGGGPINKEYITFEELETLLKGGLDRGTLEDVLAIAKWCQDNGNEDYWGTALKRMCYTIGSNGLYRPVEKNSSPMQYIYDISTLNEIFSFLTEEKISEEHLYMDSYIDGDKVVCVYPFSLSLEETIDASIIEAYYGENDEIIVSGSYNIMYLTDMSGKVDYITVHLVPDEDGKYIFGYFE